MIPLLRRPSRILLLVAGLLSLNFTMAGESYWERQLRLHGRMNLPVKATLQSKYTSCGPAVITMAYQYAYPEAKVTELDVIAYAAGEEYYTERESPFTSPEDMRKIAEHYTDTVLTGTVKKEDEALSFLTQTLTGGDPLIIDVLSRLDDPTSVAHFVVVTGISIDANPNKTKILFNDPLTGTNRWGYWLGGEGVWNAWKNNGDPGGSGWWMIISSE